MKAFFRGSLATLVGSVALFAASTALADGEACFVDTDCPGTACGDAVCNWNKPATMPSSSKPYYCNPAGSSPAGADGWCSVDADCKCMGQGAVCHVPYCSFTKAPAGAGGASSGSGGATSSAGAPSTSGGAPSTSAGAPSTSAGAPSTSAGAPSTSAGAASTTPASSDSGGGCSISAPGNTTGGFAVALGMVGLGLAFARRRR